MTQNPDYYKNHEIPEDERRDVAFQTVNAIRESVTLARNSTLPITYEFAFEIIYDLNPDLYDSIVKLLVSKNENETVKYYKEEAEASSTEDKKVEPVDLINNEINRVENLIDKKGGKATYLLKRKFDLYAAKEYFKPRNQSEHKSLNHDFYLRSREEYFGKPIYENDSYKDYKLKKDKFLRLRLLHPDKEEAILGVDLVYEHFDLRFNRVRFAHMQYKTWNNNVLYASSTKNLISQIEKMQKNLCQSGYCKGPQNKKREDYRFPYCSGFLRPTSKIQQADSKLITTGLHIPICQALSIFANDSKLTKENTRDRSIKGHIFEELFITNIAGSRWIDIDDLEKFYVEKGILSHSNRIRVHAQEIDTFSEYEKNKNRG